MDKQRAEESKADEKATPSVAEQQLTKYHQGRLIDAANTLHESCYLSKDAPLARTEVLRQVDQLKKDGGLNSEFLASQDAARAFKGSKTDAAGNISELHFENCISFLPDIKVSITPDGAKIDAKNYRESLKEADKLLVDFASAELDNPIKISRGSTPGSIVKAPELSNEEKTLAKQGVAAVLSGEESKLQEFAKKLLADPEAGEKVLAGMNWQAPDTALSMQTMASGESVLNVGSGFLGKLQIDKQGKETFYPSDMNPRQSLATGLHDISAYTRTRLSSNYALAEYVLRQNSWVPEILNRPSPMSLANTFHKLMEKQIGK